MELGYCFLLATYMVGTIIVWRNTADLATWRRVVLGFFWGPFVIAEILNNISQKLEDEG